MRISHKIKNSYSSFSPQQNVYHKHQAKADEERIGGSALVVVVGFEEHLVTDNVEHNAAQTEIIFDTLLGDNLPARKQFITENGSKYMKDIDV